VILPYVLDKYGSSAHARLAELSSFVGVCTDSDSNAIKAKKFIASIRVLNASMEIPTKIPGIIKETDLPLMAKRAFSEANPLYPVPRIFDLDDFVELYREIM